MSDLLRRMMARALGRAPTVQPVIGSRFGPEPALLSERLPDARADRLLAAGRPAGPAGGEEKGRQEPDVNG